MRTTAIKKSCLEWLTIGLASATVGFLGIWIASLLSSRVGFVIYEADLRNDTSAERQVSLDAGAFTVSKNIDTPEECDRWLFGGYMVAGQPLSIDLPGIAVRQISFRDGQARWLIKFSLVFPTLACSILTGITFWLHRRTWRKWQLESTAQESVVDATSTVI